MGVSGSQENRDKKPVVLIVGGGYAGVQVAKLLDKAGQYFVVLIDRKGYFLHNVGALRATVEQDFAQKIIIPYDRLLTKGCVVQAEVTSISSEGVQVHGRAEPIRFDYLIIATGSSYAFPGKVAEIENSRAVDLYRQLHEKIQNAQQILIIGGGPVGVELAGEIATDFPAKEVTLVHCHKTLLRPNVYNEKLYARVQDELEKLRVKLILDDRVEISNRQHLNFIEGKKTYVTERTRQSIAADLTFLCIGAPVNNRSLINGPLKAKVNPQTGRLIVNNHLQVDGFENIFAIGDISDREEKLAYLAGEQASYVAKLIPCIQQKKAYPKEYARHPNAAIFLSLGRNSGIGQLPNKGGTIIGSFIVKHLKSKDMMAGRFRSAMNYKSEHQAENKDAYSDKLDSIKSTLSLTDQNARDLLAGLPGKDLEPGQDFI